MSKDTKTVSLKSLLKPQETVRHNQQIDQEDCEHYDMEDATCLDCGKDLTEKLMCDAYDRAKDRWKE